MIPRRNRILARPAAIVLAVIALAGLAAQAGAQLPRTYVSTKGSDANPCTPGAPCRNFARAQSVTATNGEIVVLNSGGYGPVEITRSLHITAAPGCYAGITATSGPGVRVQAPSGTVSLRGLVIVGLGGTVGINVTDVARLHIDDCHIRGMNTGAVRFAPPGAGLLVVNDTTMEENGSYGVMTVSGSGNKAIQVSGCYVGYHTTGLLVLPTTQYLDSTQLGVFDSTVEYNATGLALASSNAMATVVRSTFAGNLTAVDAGSAGGGFSGALLSNCCVTGNSSALVESGSSLISFLDNQVFGNISHETFNTNVPQE